MRKLVVAIMMLGLAVPCMATTRLMKLTEDRYLLTHQKQSGFGGQGKALRLTYVKAGSLCEILGYSWLEITDTQSKGRSFGSGAATTLEVKFYHDKSEADAEAQDDLLNCQDLATEEQKERMKKELAKMKQF